jgi:hypothetical protein
MYPVYEIIAAPDPSISTGFEKPLKKFKSVFSAAVGAAERRLIQ